MSPCILSDAVPQSICFVMLSHDASLLPYLLLSHCSVFKVQSVERNFTSLASPFGKAHTVPFFLLFPFQTLHWFEMGTLQPLLQSDLKIRSFNQVFKSKGKSPGGPEWGLVGPSGLEPPTLRLSVVRSSQLSYGPSSSQSPLFSVSGSAENFVRSLAPPLRFKPTSLGFETIWITGVTLILLVEIVGFEPATSCLQGRRSPS